VNIRRAVINDEISQDLVEACEVAVELGYQGLELRSIWGIPPHQLGDRELTRAATILQDHGLELAGFCPPALKCPAPETASGVRAVTDLLQRAVEQAFVLGGTAVRFFPFYRQGAPEPEHAAAMAATVLERVEVPAGVRLQLENGTRSNAPTLRLAVRFLDALGRPDIGILWDPGNTVFSGFDPAPFPDDYRAAAGRITHVHVKDPDGTRGYVRIGEGDLPWGPIVQALVADGFDGWFSLETHWRTDRELSASERDEPWGEGISRGGVQASRACMTAFDEVCVAGAR
jgi:sugar phosphate isomerase/epimerase